MPYIYKITNSVNDKVYIGKTLETIEKRWKEHLREYSQERKENRPLYRAMLKYGTEYFNIELVEEISLEKHSIEYVNERENYWIKFYNSYTSGYNATLGGDGKALFNYEEIKILILDNFQTKEIAEKIGCSKDTVRMVAKLYNLEIFNPDNNLKKEMKAKSIPVTMICKKTNQELQYFESASQAARYIKENIFNSQKNIYHTHILSAARGQRKSAYGYYWKLN